MSTKRYCLANYILAIDITDPEARTIFGDTITIGGNGSYLDNITISRTNNIYEVAGDNTGSYIFNKNLNKTGTITISINQLHDNITIFKRLVNYCYEHDMEPLTISLRTNNSNPLNIETIATCTDCLLQGTPNQSFGNTATTQIWTFICGIIDFEE